MDFRLDHFKLYDVPPIQMHRPVTLRGQFDRQHLPATVGYLRHFANPVSKNDEGIIDRNHHLTGYELHAEPEPHRVVHLANQFGDQRLLIGDPALLLVPARKYDPTLVDPENLSHFKCYRVLEGEPIEKDVTLRDQFDHSDPMSTAVRRPLFFGVPVEKRHHDQISRVANCWDHLTIYDFAPYKEYEEERQVRDQFQHVSLKMLKAVMLAVPSAKLSWHQT